VRDEITAEQIRYSFTRGNLGNMMLNKGFDQIVDPVDDQATPRLFLLFGRVATINPSREDLLCLGASHGQGDSAIRTNRVFAETRPSAAEPVHHKKDFAALGRHFHAEAGKTRVPVNRVLRQDRQTVDCGSSSERGEWGTLSSCYLTCT
jgi:hypothetical protein